MKAYKYHSVTKEFIGEINLQVDPLESKKQKKTVYLYPPSVTIKKPPELKTDEFAVLENNEWVTKKRVVPKIVDRYLKENGQHNVVDINDKNYDDKLYTDKKPPFVFNKWNDVLDQWDEDIYKKTMYELSASDLHLSRSTEDLINLLVSKGSISIDDLPAETIARMNNKIELRNKLKLKE